MIFLPIRRLRLRKPRRLVCEAASGKGSKPTCTAHGGSNNMLTALARTVLVSLILACLTCVSSAIAQTTQPSADAQPLFNGKNFAGWYTFIKGDGKNNDPQHIFQIDEGGGGGGGGGVIHIYKDAVDGQPMPFGYIATEQEFGDYDLKFQYKWGTKRFGSRAKSRRDSGCLYHITGADGAMGGVWPHSIECQIQENDVGDIYAVGTSVTTLMDPAKAKTPTFLEAGAGGVEYTSPQGPKVNSRIIRNPMAEIDGWNTVEIIARGDTAVHIVNGQVNNRVLRATAPNPESPSEWAPLRRGRILFQAEGAEVLFRNIELHPLPLEQQEK
jgi:hypothetical protein